MHHTGLYKEKYLNSGMIKIEKLPDSDYINKR